MAAFKEKVKRSGSKIKKGDKVSFRLKIQEKGQCLESGLAGD
jgi:hypothetical protein